MAEPLDSRFAQRGMPLDSVNLMRNAAEDCGRVTGTRADFQNAFNFPLFGKLQSNLVTDSRFGQLTADITNEQRIHRVSSAISLILTCNGYIIGKIQALAKL